MPIGYARVSKTDGSQSLDLPRDALRVAGVDDAVNLYHDCASGLRDDRPVSTAACGLCGSTALAATSPIWSTRCRTCRPAGWACGCSPGDGAQIDTTTAAGRLVFGIFAALAEFAGADPGNAPWPGSRPRGYVGAWAAGSSR